MKITPKIAPRIAALATAAPTIGGRRAVSRINEMMSAGATNFEVLAAMVAYLFSRDNTPPNIDEIFRDASGGSECIPPEVQDMKAALSKLLLEVGVEGAPHTLYSACGEVVRVLREVGREPAGAILNERRKYRPTEKG